MLKVTCLQDTVNYINSTPFMLYYICTGGGQTFESEFMQFSGASKTIVGSQVSYHTSMTDLLIGPREHYCTEDVARGFAKKAYLYALMATQPEYAIGVGVTCSLATDGERDGRKHRVYIAVHNYEFTSTIEWVFDLNNPISRKEEEFYVQRSIIRIMNAIAAGNTIDNSVVDYPTAKIKTVYRVGFLHDIEDYPSNKALIYPGSWNPYHYGHSGLAKMAEEIIGVPVIHELAVTNADKGLLDYIEIQERLQNVPGLSVITDQPTFIGKAKYFNSLGYEEIVFAAGAETWNRIQDPKYAGDIPHLCAEFTKYNAKFLPFGRPGYPLNTGTDLDQFAIFHDDALNYSAVISSTELRNAA